jgi:tRNA (guanine37-N1)-methyltransferase
MKIAVITLFPEMVSGAARFGVCGRAIAQGGLELRLRNPREFADDPHKTVDDRPYGGGPGMVLKVEPWRRAIASEQHALAGAGVVFLTPQGQRFDQARARQLARLENLILVAGRYEGFDERLIEADADEELSLGDFVLSGGELAALAVIDAVARLLPGTLGDERSAEAESFSGQLLDYPHYTRPEQVDGVNVPDVLVQGNHEAIRRWRLKQSLGRTCLRRPDLLRSRGLNAEEQDLLAEFLAEQGRATG